MISKRQQIVIAAIALLAPAIGACRAGSDRADTAGAQTPPTSGSPGQSPMPGKPPMAGAPGRAGRPGAPGPGARKPGAPGGPMAGRPGAPGPGGRKPGVPGGRPGRPALGVPAATPGVPGKATAAAKPHTVPLKHQPNLDPFYIPWHVIPPPPYVFEQIEPVRVASEDIEPPPVVPVTVREEPSLRVSGIMTGDGVFAILEKGPNDVDIVKPGSSVDINVGQTKRTYQVVSIKEDTVTLESKEGNVTYQQVVPLSDAPIGTQVPGGFNPGRMGGGQGGPPFGGPGSYGPGGGPGGKPSIGPRSGK